MELRKRKFVYGWGINDADYNVVTWVDGKQKMCPLYSLWKDMLRRCYSQEFRVKPRNAGYSGCSVSETWRYFSCFNTWAKANGFCEQLRLDKDILFQGNKEYGPNTCVFVPQNINALLVISRFSEETPIGVTYQKPRTAKSKELNKPYFARLSVNGSNQRHLGFFKLKEDAHKCWQLAKAEYIENSVFIYAEGEYFNSYVADALMIRVWDLRLKAATNKETTYL